VSQEPCIVLGLLTRRSCTPRQGLSFRYRSITAVPTEGRPKRSIRSWITAATVGALVWLLTIACWAISKDWWFASSSRLRVFDSDAVEKVIPSCLRVSGLRQRTVNEVDPSDFFRSQMLALARILGFVCTQNEVLCAHSEAQKGP
jgi:hypothetical protein